MKRPKPHKGNPYGLTPTELLSVEVAAKRTAETGKFNLREAVRMTSKMNNNSAKTWIWRRMRNPNFRAALVDALLKYRVIGEKGKVGKVLEEGLEAKKIIRDKNGEVIATEPDHKARLAYVQEINKITGVYAPAKSETRKVSVNFDLKQKELDKKLESLAAEVGLTRTTAKRMAIENAELEK